MTTPDYQVFESWLDNDFDTIYELYMTVKYRQDQGAFTCECIKEMEQYLISEIWSENKLFLTEKSRVAFLKYLDYKYVQNELDIEEYQNYQYLCNKDD